MVKELRVKITDLEARVVPTSPPEDLEHRENELKDVVAHLHALEYECQKLYNDTKYTWNRWIKDEDLKKASHNVEI